MDNIKVLIVEDDLFMSKTVEIIISRNFPLINIVGSAISVKDAYNKFKTLQPNLLILDIELADGDAFELLRSLNSDNFRVVFVSTHTNLLIKAVECSLVEYVKKPFSEDDFLMALDKVIEHFSDNEKDMRMEVLFENLRRTNNTRQIFIETEEGGDKIEIGDIEFGEALSQGTILHMDSGKEINVFRPLRRFENLFSPHNFYRCHSQYVVNYKKIKKVEEDIISLQSGAKIPFDNWRIEQLLKLMDES